ncbi:MAG: HAMP domain-containing histidine kinase [Sandaracinaceae bacterium]|nr:HAMP domain-containing histidine kinase [Sandaracinaceae bacterium]
MTKRRRRERRERPPRTVEDEARRRVGLRIGFIAHAIVFGSTLLLLLVVAGFLPALIVGLAWAIGLSIHAFFAVAAPVLREQWVDEEVLRLRAEAHVDRTAVTHRHTRSLEQLSASIAHEIRNPITAAKSLVQQMGEDPHNEANLEYAKVALEELDRVEASISHLLRYAREEPVERGSMQVDAVIDSALGALAPRLDGVQIQREVEAVEASGDAEKTRQVIVNLVSNALDALDGAPGQPTVTIASGHNLAGSAAWVRVSDNGPGIPKERLERIFDPFYTSKSTGTGLGLAISKKLVEAQGGTLEVQSEPGRTEFVMELPTPRARA